MRVIVAGSRTIEDVQVVAGAIDASGFDVSVVICGMARGVDMLGYRWAHSNGVPVEKFPADWSLGRSAGYQRNEQMANVADALVAIWDGTSRGTKHMIDIATRKGLKVFVYRPGELTASWHQ